MNWWRGLKVKVKFQEPMKKHTTFRVGGPARYFTQPRDTQDLKLLLKSRERDNIPILILGAGSNILAADKGVDGLVIHLHSPFFKKLSLKKSRIYASCGVSLSKVSSFAKEHGLSGLEFLAGIPGTVGGALAMNAGLPGENIGDLVEMVTVMDYQGRIKTLNKKNIKFAYRQSNLARYIILSAVLKMIKKNKQEIKDSVRRYLKSRHRSQDTCWPSAGCVFKNPARESAGRLIDLCGLKGKKIGDACISKKHANFILNLGSAKAHDVLRLMALVEKKVKNKFNVNLEPEIKIWQ